MALESFGNNRDILKRTPISSPPVSGERNFIVESGDGSVQTIDSMLVSYNEVKIKINGLDTIKNKDEKMNIAADLLNELIDLRKKLEPALKRMLVDNPDAGMHTGIYQVDFNEMTETLRSKIRSH